MLAYMQGRLFNSILQAWLLANAYEEQHFACAIGEDVCLVVMHAACMQRHAINSTLPVMISCSQGRQLLQMSQVLTAARL